MAQELARLKSIVEKRDNHVETLEKSLVQLSIEWYTMGEENKKFSAAHATITEQRLRHIVDRLRNTTVARCFKTWSVYVGDVVQHKVGRCRLTPG